MDAICLAAVLEEVREAVLGGRIDKIYQPARDEVILQIHGQRDNVRLLFSASPAHPRVQITNLSRENPAEPPMFCMLLRKHLTGGRITKVIQPEGERIARFFVETVDELGDRVERQLVLEAMGRRANLILLDGEERITDCIRRVDGDLSRGERQIMPGMFYRLPAAHPGVPPLLERELRFRGIEGSLEDAINGLYNNVKEKQYTPTLLIREGKMVDFSFLPILQYGPETQRKTFESFGELLDTFYAQLEQQERTRQRGQDLIRTVTNARDRVERKLNNQARELAAACDRERTRQLGDIITSNLYQLSKGMRRFTALDFYDPAGGEVEIGLDPLLTPQQNAAKYYKEYNKGKKAEEMLTIQMEKGRRELDYLNSVLEAITLAEGERDLQEIRQELTETGYLRRPSKAKERQKKVAGKPMEFRSSAGLRISVGKNNSQNDLLTCKQAYKSDIWFHTQKIHGSHVILWCEGREPDAASLTEAAVLAAWFSQGREGKKVPVDYTPVKYVKKPAGARPGMVVYTTYQTAYVDPDEALVNALRVK